jgi:hypothetical protein
VAEVEESALIVATLNADAIFTAGIKAFGALAALSAIACVIFRAANAMLSASNG